MKAIRYEKDTVLVQEGKIKAWVDVVVYNEKIYYDWNKMAFYLWKKEDLQLREWQENADNFENATNLAIETLEKLDIIYQDEKGSWHQTEKYHTIKGASPLK